MSKVLYVCLNDKEISAAEEERIKNICNDLNAENINANPTYTYKDKHIVFGILNPNPTINHSRSNILLGGLFDESKWEEVGKNFPDGNYAIFRSDEKSIEIVTDVLGTRTVWFYKNEKIFVASTSQRAIIQYLGNFEFDERVIPWIISSGTPGPSYSWDKRIKRLPPDGYLLLDRENWNLKIDNTPVEFIGNNVTETEHETNLKTALVNTFNSLNLDFSKWVVSLSGGYDSRAILSLLENSNQNLKEIKTVTWGDKSSIGDKRSDATIAGKIAKKFNVENKFYDTGDGSGTEEFSEITDKFLKNGEGRNDQILGYLDGFKTWKILYENNNHGVLRGDEVFGYNKIFSPLIIRSFMGLSMCEDYPNLSKFNYINSLHQQLPEEFHQKQDESLDTWRDRLFQMYRIPLIQASLADLKYPYIEQINPFLSRKIVSVVRQLPDHLRTNKFLFRKITMPMSPKVPFAHGGNSPEIFKKFLYFPPTVKSIRKELLSTNAKSIFPEEFLNEISENLKEDFLQSESKKDKILKALKRLTPNTLKKRLAQKTSTLHLDSNKLGYRIYIVCRMNQILKEDSGKFKFQTEHHIN